MNTEKKPRKETTYQKGIHYMGVKIYRVSQEECEILRESVP